jgi:hypothetical protein
MAPDQSCGSDYRQVQTGDRLRLDGARGLVEVLERRSGGEGAA